MIYDRFVVSEYNRKRAFWTAFKWFVVLFLVDIALWYFFIKSPDMLLYAVAIIVGFASGIFLTGAISLHFLRYALEPLDKD